MRDKAVAMLTALGVAGAADDPLLDIVLNNVQWRIKNLSNLSEIPEGLESLAVSMAVGEYLNMKKCSGQLEGFDLDAAVKSIQEGDTNITFALGEGSSTPEQRLNSLIDYCLHELHLTPSAFYALPRRERAFIIAAIDVRVEAEKKKQKEIERKQRRGRHH